MSYTQYVDGNINFSSLEEMDACLKELKANNWIDDNGGICMSYPSFSDPVVDKENLTIDLNHEAVTKFSSFIAIVTKYTNDINYSFVGADGFGASREAGVVTDGIMTRIEDLVEWAKGHSDEEVVELVKEIENKDRNHVLESLSNKYIEMRGEQ